MNFSSFVFSIFLTMSQLIFENQGRANYIIYEPDLTKSFAIPENMPPLLFHHQAPETLTAVIIGAGIAGLMDAIVLKKHGFEVIVVEKRTHFNRLNIMNLKGEIVHMFEKLELNHLLQQSFIDVVHEHNYFLFSEETLKNKFEDQHPILKANPDSVFDFSTVDHLYKEDGKYSARIADLQFFLAQEAIKRGIYMITNADTTLQEVAEKNIYTVTIQKKESSKFFKIKEPTLIVVADGAHSKLLKQLGGNYALKEEDACHHEQWIFGNVKTTIMPKEGSVGILLQYPKDYDSNTTPSPSIQMSHSIFHKGLDQINVSVSVGHQNLTEKQIANLIQEQAQKAALLKGMHLGEFKILWTTQHSLKISIRKASSFYYGKNLVIAGDAAGNSSPLAGLGGTLGLTAYPYAMDILARRIKEELVYGLMFAPYEAQKIARFFNFEDSFLRDMSLTEYSKNVSSYVDRWIKKSSDVKHLITHHFSSAISEKASE